MNPSLTEFLLARIEEDEEIARDAGTASSGALAVALLPEPTRLHVMTWAPNRVLAECEVRRQIVKDFMDYASEYRKAPSDFAAGRRHAALLAVTRLVSVYATHPDYLPEWTP